MQQDRNTAGQQEVEATQGNLIQLCCVFTSAVLIFTLAVDIIRTLQRVSPFTDKATAADDVSHHTHLAEPANPGVGGWAPSVCSSRRLCQPGLHVLGTCRPTTG